MIQKVKKKLFFFDIEMILIFKKKFIKDLNVSLKIQCANDE